MNWWKDNQNGCHYSNVRWCADGNLHQLQRSAVRQRRHNAVLCLVHALGRWQHDPCVANRAGPWKPTLLPARQRAGHDHADLRLCARRDPAHVQRQLAFTSQGRLAQHNFSFTSEVRYWFSYSTSKQYTLDFTGDDDVWVFVNRKLAVDMGGIHTPVEGQLVLNATGGGTVTVTPSAGAACKTEGVLSTCTGVESKVDLGMTNDGVYEIAVFQAERPERLDLQTHPERLQRSAECLRAHLRRRCVSPGEQCDNGTANNLGGYNQCRLELPAWALLRRRQGQRTRGVRQWHEQRRLRGHFRMCPGLQAAGALWRRHRADCTSTRNATMVPGT